MPDVTGHLSLNGFSVPRPRSPVLLSESTTLPPSTPSTSVPGLRSSVFLIAALALILTTSLPSANAQSLGTIERIPGNVPNYYYFARVGEPTITVSVWGSVRNPGTYEVRENINIGELLSLSGGPARIGEQQHRRAPDIIIQISRPGADGRSIVFRGLLHEMISQPHEYPIMQPGDVVVVETVPHPQPFGWRDAVSIVSAVGVLALAVERILRVSR